jgi:hypothetical protein
MIIENICDVIREIYSTRSTNAVENGREALIAESHSGNPCPVGL